MTPSRHRAITVNPRLKWRPKRGQANCFEGFAGLHWYRVSQTGEHWYWYFQSSERQSRPYMDAELAMAVAQRH